MVVWSDAGDDRDLLPFPDTPRFSRVFQTMEFCPVFFERSLKLNEGPRENYTNEGIFPHTTQPLAALPCRYGETLDWCKIGSDPLLILQEIFHFQSSAASQYLNMLRQLTTETISRIPPTGEELPSMADLLHFDYTKTVLSQWCAHFKVLIGCLDDDILKGAGASGQQDEREKVQSTLRQDLKYLNDEGEALIALCESGKATIMSSFSVYESTRAAAESRLVTQLTKATNRITFIFLPISLVTSVFGMNFKQFGQGDLDITLWLAVTLPILAVCILINESGGWIVRSCSAVYTSCTGGR